MMYEGGAKPLSTDEIGNLFAQLERDLPPPTGGRRGGKKMSGGGCTPEQRQRVRIALAAALATGLYLKGPELASRATGLIKDVVTEGVNAIMNIECSIGIRKSALQNAVCTKYSEFLTSINTFIQTANTPRGADMIITAATTAALTSAWGTFRTSLSAVVSGVRQTGSMMSTGFEALVDEMCKAMPVPPATAAAAAPVAEAAGAPMGTGGKKHKSRKGGVKRRRSRIAKRTLRRVYRY